MKGNLLPATVLSLSLSCIAWSAEAVDPGPNEPDEPMAAEFSLERAAAFLDSASLQWQKERDCLTCHTNMSYLIARPGVAGDRAAHDEVRRYVEHRVSDVWPKDGPRYDPAEVIAAAAALALNDAATTGKLHPLTRVALDRMWTRQREDGGWDWLKCGWPPMESDDHYGVTLAAIAVGSAPDGYAETEAAEKGVAKIKTYLQNNPPPTLHHQAMILWASKNLDGLMSHADKESCKSRLLALQHDDGGWGLATFGDWKRADGSPQDTQASDGYGTGFALFVLHGAGVPSQSEAIQRGIRWLKTHQRASGRWFTRSLNKDNMHFITHAGTAMAVLALSTCDRAE
jgi:squalene-hopene/tetraprenyl-beta-curcumene cyclase